MTKKKYELTEEHRKQLPAWRDKWINIAMSTKGMTEEDKEKCREAVVGLYKAANLPPPKHIVFVPSPFVLRIAGGFAAAIWHLQKNRKTDEAATWDATRAATGDATRAATGDATRDATRDATWDATRAATWAATGAATGAATRDATWDATGDATGDATRDATRAATWAATRDATRAATWAATGDATEAAVRDATRDATGAATWDATGDATRDATRAATGAATWAADSWFSPWIPSLTKSIASTIGKQEAEFFLSCSRNSYTMWNGGNQWVAYPSFLSFFRHVAKLDLDYSAWQHYETLAELSGPRIMHPDFCMISDKPELLSVDSQNRPHADNGPFCRWRDGTALYAVHGVRVPHWLMENPERLTIERIEQEKNAEVRRVMIEKFGIAKYVREANFQVLDESLDPLGLPRRLLRKADMVVVELTNSTKNPDGTRRMYHIPCHPELRPLLPDGGLGEPQKMTALNAVASTYGLRGEEYLLEIET